MSSEQGFTLIETVVATLIGVALVVAVGVLGERIIRHRANADSNSAATSLAQMQMERLRAEALSNPTAAQCAASPKPALCAGSHGPFSVTEDNQALLSATYSLRWVIDDSVPRPSSKRITVTVTHLNNPFVRCELVTYYKVS